MISTRLLLTMPLLVTSAITGCGTSDPSYAATDIETTAPSGTIADMAWAAKSFLIESSGSDLSVSISDQASTEDCPFLLDEDKAGVLLSVPAQNGEFALSFGGGHTITLYVPPAQNYIAVDGYVVVSDVTATTAKIGFIADAGDGGTVNGTISGAICP